MCLSVSKYLSYFPIDPCSWLESEDIKTTNKRFCWISNQNKYSIIVASVMNGSHFKWVAFTIWWGCPKNEAWLLVSFGYIVHFVCAPTLTLPHLPTQSGCELAWQCLNLIKWVTTHY